MSRPASFYRWYRGKVWHLGWTDDAAACGSERPQDAETVGERAPINARVCVDCVASALHLYGLAASAQANDPRHVREPIEALIERSSLGTPEAKALRASVNPETVRRIVEAANTLATRDPDEWPCGSCGHANVDHDCDDGTCCAYGVTRESGREEQCECRGLTRAGGEPVQHDPVDDELAPGDEFEYEPEEYYRHE